MNVQEILKEIDALPMESRMEVYKQLRSKLQRIEHLKAVLDNFVGRGKNVLGLEPQEYINHLRNDDRI